MIGNLVVRLMIIIFLCTQYILVAQGFSNPDSALQNILEEHKGTPLSLKQALVFAENNATSIRISEGEYLAAQGSVRREAGFFDPEFFFNFNHLDEDSPTASFFAGAPVLVNKQSNYQSGLRMNLPIGTQLELSLNATRLQTNSSFAFLNPEYNSFGRLSIRQPLLNGFSSTARENLTRTEKQMDAQRSRFEQQNLAINSDVEQAYWDLYASQRNFAVQQLIHDQAGALLKETELRFKSGLVGPNQVANARTFLAEQELLLLEREEQFDSQSDRLASLIGARPESGNIRFIPLDDPPIDFNVANVETLIGQALENNLNLQASQHEIEAITVMKDAAKWRYLPKVDLYGSIGGSGLAGSPQTVIFGEDTLRSTRSGSFSDAFSQTTSRDFPNWNLGVEVNIPIGLRSGLGEKDRLEAEVFTAKVRSTELSRLIEEQVRIIWRELSHGTRRINAATEGVKAAQEQVRIGLIEFQNGRTTAFELVRLGADLAAAQQRYSEALVRNAKAVAVLRELTSGKFSGKIQ